MGIVSYTPRDWANGLVVLDSHLDTEVRDPWTEVQAAWSSGWDPASSWVGSTTNPVLNNGTTRGRYHQIGRTILWEGRIAMGSTTTYGSGTYSFSLPATPLGTAYMVGTALLMSASAIHVGVVLWTGSAVNLRFHGASGIWSPTVPFTLASGSSLYVSGAYQAA